MRRLQIGSIALLFLISSAPNLFSQTDSWLPLGNGNSDGFWHRTIFCYANDPYGNTYTGTDSGLYRSTDNGNNWTRCNSPQNAANPHGIVTSLLISRNGTIYERSFGIGIVRSKDSTRTWFTTSLVDSEITAIQLDTADHVLASRLFGTVLRSTDEGATWKIQGTMPGPFPLRAITVDKRGRILAGTGVGGAFRSSNDGVAWDSLGFRGLDIWALLVTPGGTIFAGTGNQGMS